MVTRPDRFPFGVGVKVVGLGQVNFWHGGSLWIGQSTGAVEPHAHHAHQVTIGLLGFVRFRAAESSEWTAYPGAFVPSHLEHAFDGTGSTTATIFCEPESEVGRRLSARFGTNAIAGVDPDETEALAADLRDIYASGAPDEELNEAARQVLVRLATRAGSISPAPDPRILRALEEIERRLDEPITLEQIADAVHLSPSRFRHLFVAETGMAFRPYVLWARLQRALKTAIGGQSWTEAAYAANFADSAHLTRTFRRMFGIAPTALGRPLPETGRAALRQANNGEE